jgi:hypothetical protein
MPQGRDGVGSPKEDTMSIDYTVDSLENIAEELKGFYEKTDNGFRLAVNGVIAANEVTGLKNALNEIKSERDTLKKAVQPWKEAGLFDKGANEVLKTFDEFEKLRKIDPAKEADRLAAEKAEGVAREWAAKFNTATKSLETERDSYRQQVMDLKIQNTIRDAAIETKANPKLIDPIIRQFIGVRDDGNIFVRDPKTGQQAYNNDGSEMSVAQKLHNMRADSDYQVLFEGTSDSGSGRSGGAFPNPLKTASGKIRLHINDAVGIAKNLEAVASNNVEWIE